MQDNIQEFEFTQFLFDKGYLPGPIRWDWGKNSFSIQKDRMCKTSGCIFSCLNYTCRKKFSIRKYSIYELFPFIQLLVISEIIACFYVKEFIISQAYEFLTTEKNIVLSKRTICMIYNKLSELIINYLHVVYNTEILDDWSKVWIFAVD